MVTPSGLFPAGSPTAAALGASKNSHYVSFALNMLRAHAETKEVAHAGTNAPSCPPGLSPCLTC